MRDRWRSNMVRQIKKLALRQLREVGASGISLRQIARDLEVVSSAIYRYFPGRDELLTALIVDAYAALGGQAEKTSMLARGQPPRQRWLAVCDAVRAWARAHKDQYALIYGSPVPGFHASRETMSPAARAVIVLTQIVREALEREPELAKDRPLPSALSVDLARLRERAFPDVPEAVLADVLTAWTQLLGSVSLELFGHLDNIVDDFDALFAYQMNLMADRIGL